MTEPTKGPLETQREKPLDQPIIDVLHRMADPRCILFSAVPGKPAALMCGNMEASPVPHAWIRRLVKRGYIDQAISSKSKVASMGWIQYSITYEGQQALNDRGRRRA